ncbi:hypothetical protein [Pandoraea sputorum]|uniref:hypothetical protein n=1 Tax=Pandoraea sputorum TaxID=93222 RepID=UPI00123F2353|nr:hypothetical protein [Pandoraea sputorum]VVE84400.1 hypothetical protein PSP31120_04633 [Pandoraea sputorum]
MDGLLLAFETVLFGLGLAYIYPRDKMFGFYFVFLFIYGIFAQLGYHFFPEASEAIMAYFGDDVWLPSVLFITASLVSFVLAFVFLRPVFYGLMAFRFSARPAAMPGLWRKLALGWLLATSAYMIGFVVLNGADLSWYSAQQDDLRSTAPALALLIFFVKIDVGTLVVLYRLARQRVHLIPHISPWLPFVVRGAFFLFITFKLGNRTDVLACFLGLALMEMSQTRLSVRIMLRALFFGFLVVSLLLLIEATRYSDSDVGPPVPTSVKLLVKDYYPPAHMLFAAMAYDYVSPWEVIESNTSNAAILLGYPYLQETVTDLFRPDLATRSVGYAFYVLTEGFMFMGYWGFLYNGVVLIAGLCLWRRMATSDSREYNLLLLGLFGCMMVNVVRGQSSYFVKYLYMFVLPNALLYLSLVGMRIRLRIAGPRPARNPA